MLAEELVAYVGATFKTPPLSGTSVPTSLDRVEKLELLKKTLGLPDGYLFLGPTIVLHWRNRIIHRGSNADLSKAQRQEFLAEAPVLYDEFKHLDPGRLLQDFDSNTPTLKEVSSLVAMSLRFVKATQRQIPPPRGEQEVRSWLEHLGLGAELDRVERIGRAKGKAREAVDVFLRTTAPSLADPYFEYCAPTQKKS